MIFEIVNTILLLCSLAINIKILNIANKMRPPKISLADIATDMMNSDNFDTHEACDNNNNYEVGESINRNDKNNVSHQNIYKDRIDIPKTPKPQQMWTLKPTFKQFKLSLEWYHHH